MRKFTIITISLLLSYLTTIPIYAQYENIWAFGGCSAGGAGLDFNSGTAVPIKTSMFSPFPEAAASICDHDGHLLFYTEGSYIWDKNGKLMNNDLNLSGLPMLTFTNPPYSPTTSTSQGAQIVPVPDSKDKFYIFSLSGYDYKYTPEDTADAGKLYYSIVDLSLNGGLGDVLLGQKGIFLDSNLTEQMIAVGGDSCNSWLIVCRYYPDENGLAGTLQFRSYQVTEAGVISPPVVSPIMKDYAGVIGNMSISPNRKKIARSGYGALELYDFNFTTGTLSNQILLDSQVNFSYGGGYGNCFSPDNSKLYMTHQADGLVQYDLSSNNVQAILSSRIIIDSIMVQSDLKRGPNDKIYGQSDEFYGMNFGSIGAINFPNLKGLACQYDRNAVTLLSATQMDAGLPNDVSTAHPIILDTTYSRISKQICGQQNDTIRLNASNGSFWYRWEDNSNIEIHKVWNPGTYVVHHGTYCHYWIDTFIVELIDLDPVITVNKFDLGTVLHYHSYQWLLNGVPILNATDSIYTIKQNGDYSVIVENGNCSDTSPVYNVNNYGDNNVGLYNLNDTGVEIKLFPNPTRDNIYFISPRIINVRITGLEGKLIKERFNPEIISVSDLENGIYLLSVSDSNGSLLKVVRLIKQ